MYNVKLATKTFNDAKAVCVEKGSHLFEIKTGEELSQVMDDYYQYMKSHKVWVFFYSNNLYKS
jgi:hypothetical protein